MAQEFAIPEPRWAHRLPLVLLMQAAGVAWLHVTVQAILLLPSRPGWVNLWLDPTHLFGSIVAVCLLLTWTGFAVGLTGWRTQGRLWHVLGLPVWAGLTALAAWALLDYATASAALHDLLGMPGPGWPGGWAPLGRFVAIYGGGMLLLSAGGLAVTAGLNGGWRRALAAAAIALAVSLPVIALGRWAALHGLHPGNLGKFLSVNGASPEVYLGGLALLLGANASLLAWAWRVGRQRKGLVVAAVIITVALLPVGWVLANAALGWSLPADPTGPSALTVLIGPLGPTRIVENSPLVRWLVVQLALVAVLAYGQWTSLLLWGPAAKSEAEPEVAGARPPSRPWADPGGCTSS